MTKLQAGVGHVQLKKLNKLVESRRSLASVRNELLFSYPELNVQSDTSYSKNCYYLYTIILPNNTDGKKRDQIKKLMEEEGIGCAIANRPTYKYNSLIQKTVQNEFFPDSEDLGNRIICPVIHPEMTNETNEFVINSFIEIYRAIFKVF